MKEVKKCSISGVAFTMDTDAYEALEAYLDSLKKTYKDTADGAEIVADIEARIAELILSAQDNTRIVEQPLILNIIQQMGSAEDISEQSADRDLQCDTPRIPRRLYRDTENAKLGGVCAGIGKYFDIDPVWVRLGLFLPLLFTCFGWIPFLHWFSPMFGNLFGIFLICYFIMWFAVPAARSARQKLEMNGEKITAQSIGEVTTATATACAEPDSKAKPIVAEVVSVFGKVVLILLKIIAGFIVFGLIMAACALIIGMFALIVGGEGFFTPAVFGNTMSIWTASLGILAGLIPVILLIYVLMCLIASRKPGGKTVLAIFLLFCWLFCGIVIAAFADMVAGTFNAFGADGAMVEAAKTNGAAGMVSIMFMVFAVVFGLLQKKFNFSGWKESVISIVFIVLSFVIGANLPLILGKAAWSYITFVYIFFAAVLPMWLLKQPRDHMTTFMFVAMIVGAVVGLLVAHPTMNLPVFTGFTNEKLGTMFPILFVTVACGAVSGFHSLVSSGTSSKTVDNEKDMLKVGYGAMILESLLAVLALCVAGAAAAADGTPAAGTPFQIFSRGVAGFFEMFGVPAYAATVFMTMCVSALALTSLDAVARIGRMSFQELFSVDDMEHAEGWRKLLCNVYFSTFITLVFGFILTKIGYANIWPLFGSANQLLSALVLATLCVFLKVTGRSNKMLFPPLIIMLCVTFTALVQRLIAMVKAISTAASVTIPAGETTWGAVFIANGLQLILAVLLIVLGLNIVFHSFSAYKKAEHNSEAKA